jgi:hypothetical protein
VADAADQPDLVADEYYAEYEAVGDSGGVLVGLSPVAEVYHNSSLVLEDCGIERNFVRHPSGAAISIITLTESDYEVSDFPSAVAVWGGSVQSSFSPRSDSGRVRTPPAPSASPASSMATPEHVDARNLHIV